MKVISKTTFEVTVLAPETDAENQEIQRMIREVGEENIPPESWVPVDNRPEV